jgi:hypothetical protein
MANSTFSVGSHGEPNLTLREAVDAMRSPLTFCER